MNTTEHLLTILSEECAEVAHRACKAVRFGMNEIEPGRCYSNRQSLEHELSDLVAVAETLGLYPKREDMDKKKARVKKYMEYAKQVGTLKDARSTFKSTGQVEFKGDTEEWVRLNRDGTYVIAPDLTDKQRRRIFEEMVKLAAEGNKLKQDLKG